MTGTVKRVVTHARLYRRVDGKVQHISKGTVLLLTKTEAESSLMQSHTADPGQVKQLSDGELKEVRPDPTAQALAEQLQAAKARIAELEAAGSKTTGKK